jgi:hypothetical protein
MLLILENLFRRANKCPFACLLKVLLSVSFIYTIHLAISHQIDVSPYPFAMLVALVGLIATLAVAFDWSCRLRNADTKDKLSAPPAKPGFIG